MIIYISALIWVYVAYFLGRNKCLKFNFIFFVPLIVFSVARGASGPDTLNYYHKFLNIESDFSGYLNFTAEPVTYILMYISDILEGGWFLFSVIYGSIVILLYASIMKNYSLYRVFLLTIGPVLLIDGLVNTIRVTIAYLFFLAAYQNRKFWLFWLLSFLSHVSSLLLIIGSFLAKRINIKASLKNFLMMLALLMIFALIMVKLESIVSFFPRIQDKLSQYSSFKTQSSLSGLSDIFVIFSLLALGSYYNRKSNIEFFIDIMMTLIICFGCYVGAMYSIGFMRLLKIIIIVIAMSPMLLSPRRKIPTFVLLVIGGLYTMNYLRIVFSGESYLPYGLGLS